MNDDNLFAVFIDKLKQLTTVELQDTRYKVALSGGLDSMVLLHLFSRLNSGNVSAQHIHHGLSENADDWLLFCEQQCAQLGIVFNAVKVKLTHKNRSSLEAVAREARYKVLTDNMATDDYLVTAHHQDDQLETVLLALKRGAGVTGLQGIVAKQALTNGFLIRPLLCCSRVQLENYAQHYQLNWIEDESNQDQAFDRNFIRHRITPLLTERWPSIAKTVSRSAEHCQAQQVLIDEITQIDALQCQTLLMGKNILRITELKNLSEVRRNNLLRYWFKGHGLVYPSTKQLLAIWQDIALAREDAMPNLCIQTVSIRRYRGHLYLFDPTALTAQQKILWQGQPILDLGRQKISIKVKNALLFWQQNPCVEICFRPQLQAALTCTPKGRNGSRSIKKLLHEYHVPPWLRDHVAFLFVNGILLEAVGLWQCETALDETVSLQAVFI